MKKTTLTNARLLMLSLLIAVTTMSLIAADVPSITMYYPGQRDENPVDLKPTMKAYTYFEAGSKVVQNKARVIQDGKVIGTCVYAGNANGTTTTCMDQSKPENASLKDLAAGLFTIEIYEVTYIADGVEQTYSDESAPIGSVIYNRPASNGSVVSKSGFSDNIMYSYYVPDGQDGLLTYTFDKPVVADGISAELQYGMGEQYTYTRVLPTLSDDGLTLTIDLRGTCYNVDALAPGVTFVDDSGNPTDPPVYISLVVNGLNCADGTKIATNYCTPEGKVLTVLEGQIWETYNYVDLTFATPYMQDVYFYSSEAPSQHYASINDDTDMMGILLIGDIYSIKSYDLTLTNANGSVKAEDPTYSDVSDTKATITCKIPAAITSSNGLTISFDNVVYNKYDGSEHVIRPWVFDGKAPELLTVSAVKALAAETDCILYPTLGIKVTFSAEDAGMMFAQDNTAGLILVTEDYSVPFEEGYLINGKLHGTYLGDSMFMLDLEASEYTLSPCDISEGWEMTSVEEALSGEYDACLLTFNATDDMPIYYDADSEILFIGTDPAIGVVTEFVPDLELPAAIGSVTGVLYNPEFGEIPMLIIRTQDDIVEGSATPQGETVSTIAELKMLEPLTPASIQLTDAKVTYVNDENGMTIIEDATGAICIYLDDYTPFTSQGKSITALLSGMYYMDGMFAMDSNGVLSYSETDTDVSVGAALTPAEAMDIDNAYRLVSFYNESETNQPFEVDEYTITIDGSIYVLDYFGALPWDYTFPSEIISVTGIVINSSGMPMDDDDWDDDWGETTTIIIAPRSVEDIKAETTSIGSVNNDSNASQGIYNILGVKSGTQDAAKLKSGLYIINGKKVYVK